MIAPPATDLELGRRRISPQPVGLTLLLLAAFGLVIWFPVGGPARLLVAVALVAVAVIDLVAVRRAGRDLEVRVDPPADALAHHDADFFVLAAGTDEEVRIVLPGTTPELAFVTTGGEPAVVGLPCPPRGVHHTLGLSASVSGPFGLFEAVRRIRYRFPRPLAVGPAPLAHPFEVPPLRTVRYGLTQTAPTGRELFRGVRSYQRGDPRRQVHWKATAHRGELMVRENEGSGVIVLRLVLDLHGPGPAAEAALGRAAWVGREALRWGWHIELFTAEPVTPAPIPPPVDAFFFLAIAPEPVRPTHPRHGRVTTVRELDRRLAAAGFGPPDVPVAPYATRVISERGDEWR